MAEPAVGRRGQGREGEMQRGKPEKKREAREASARSPEKPFYKIGEVCEMTDTQPYVLRFWESEFPQLAPRKSRAGQRVYEQRDIDLILRIKKLLYEDEYTIAGARKKLEDEDGAATAPPPEGPAPPKKEEAFRRGRSETEKRLSATLESVRRELRGIKEILEP